MNHTNALAKINEALAARGGPAVTAEDLRRLRGSMPAVPSVQGSTTSTDCIGNLPAVPSEIPGGAMPAEMPAIEGPARPDDDGMFWAAFVAVGVLLVMAMVARWMFGG